MQATQPKVVRINKPFAQLKDAVQRYVVSYGGRRSSKSVSHSQIHVRRAVKYQRHFLIMRKVARSLRLSCWPRYKSAVSQVFDLRDCDVNKSDMTIALPNGSTFTFVGADDPDKLKSIENITDVVLEEAPEFDEIDLDTVDAGLSPNIPTGEPPAQITIIFNPMPIIPANPHWLVRRFLSNGPYELGIPKITGDVLVFRSWYRHNAFCPKAWIDMIEKMKARNLMLWKMWALGEIVKAEGAIFPNWDTVPEPPSFEALGPGLDFGFSGDPAAVIRVWENSTDVWAQELVYDWELTNPLLSACMLEAGISKDETIMADNAEPKSIKELSDMGWRIEPCDKGADYKRAAIRYLQGKAIHVVLGSNNLQSELMSYCWPKNEVTGKFLPKIPDGNDHAIDAIIYRLFTRNKWGEAGKQPSSKEHRPLTAGLRGVRF